MNIISLSKKTISLLFCFYFILSTLIYSGSINAQTNIELANLFFTPVPFTQADLITLNTGGLSELDRQSAEEAIPRFQNEVRDLEANNPNDPELINKLNSLGLAMQALEQHEEAIEIYNKSASLAVNLFGEDSLQQIPMLEQSILSHLKLNNISKITETEEFLYNLRADQYDADSAEMYSAMTNLANWYSSAYLKEGYLSQRIGFIPRVTSSQRVTRQLGIGANSTGNDDPMVDDSGSPGGRGNLLEAIASGSVVDVTINDVTDIRLRKLDTLYDQYQESYSNNTTLNMVIEVARRIAQLSYHTAQEMNYERIAVGFDPNYSNSREEAIRNSEQRRDESYDVGKIALEYVLNVVQTAEGISPQQVTLALLDLADWELAYGKIVAAQEGYQAAYQVLREEGFNDASIDSAFATAVPVAIPRVGSFPVTQQASGSLGLIQNPNYKGYIDVSFAIDDSGNSIRTSILGSSSDDNARIQRILEDQIQITKFRPLLQEGNLTTKELVRYRYYYSY